MGKVKAKVKVEPKKGTATKRSTPIKEEGGDGGFLSGKGKLKKR